MIFILLLSIPIQYILSYIILPLYKEKQNTELISEPIEVIQNLFNSEIYTIIEIGSEMKKVKAYLTHLRGELIIAGKEVKNHKYDESHSKTYFCVYNETKDFYNGVFSQILLSKEDFFLQNDKNEIQNIRLNFILGVKSFNNVPYEGVLGLQLPFLNSEAEYNIIRSLKNGKIINSYDWFLDLDNLENGGAKMYIGTLPHIINKQLNENNLQSTNAVKSGVYMNWGMEFSETYYGSNNKLGKSYQAYVHFDFGLIFGPNELMDILDNKFFDYYIKENICFKESYGIEKNIFYYCKNDKRFNVKKFQTIYFENNEMESVFEFNYKDLFYYRDGLIYFLIMFREYNKESYLLGEIFLRKYKLSFNQDKKNIGYYKNRKISQEKKFKKKEKGIKFNITNFLLILILLTIIIIALIYYKKFTNRKIRANELEENYQYISKNDISKENNKKLTDENL